MQRLWPGDRVVPPDAPQALFESTQKAGVCVFVADGTEATCPDCGLAYDLPAGEQLDPERTDWGRWLAGLLEEGSTTIL